MNELLKTRWQERDAVLNKRFQAVISQMILSGALRSSRTTLQLFDIACDEFNGSRQAIVATAIDSLRLKSVRNPNRDALLKKCVDALGERKTSIESLLRQCVNKVAVFDNGMDLSSKMEAAVNELKVELVRALDEYQTRNSDTLKDQIVRKLLNIPLVAWLFILFLVVSALITQVSNVVNLLKGS